MQRDRFVTDRRDQWAELEELLKRARGGLRRLSGDDVFRLGQLYLSATSDLAAARRDFPEDRVMLYLNGLVARAHPIVYRQRSTSLARIGRFLRYGFPQAYRDAGRYIGLAFAVFALSALVSALLVAYRPSMADVLLPGEAQSLRSVMEHHHLWMKSATENHSVAANFIMLNNIHVAVAAFALGVIFGVGALYVMLVNGINLGAVAMMVAQYKLSLPFWSFVLPHGVIELSVIFMAGGAGMMVGDSILRPGLMRRRDALVRAARHAIQLIFMAIPLLVVAGTIEGFFSPSDAPSWTKFAVGIVSGVLLYSYLLRSRPRVQRRLYAFEDIVAPADARPVTATSAL